MIGPWTVSADIIEVCYVFAFSFGVLATIALSWHWISRTPFAKRLYFKSASFGVLYSEIAERRDELSTWMEEEITAPYTVKYLAKIQELVISLKALDIPCPAIVPIPANTPITALSPENKDSYFEWWRFLTKLAALARVCDIKEARALARGEKK